MPIIQGFVRNRKHQVGTETSFSSNTPQTRWLPYKGSIVVEPNRTQPDVDTGYLDPVLPDYMGAEELTGSWSGPQSYDNLPYIFSYGVVGNVSPTGGVAKTWTFQPGSSTPDAFTGGTFTEYWGDDVTSDSILAAGGVINDWTLSFDNDLGAYQFSGNNYYAKGTYGLAQTAALTLDTSPEWVYGAHTVVYLDTNAGSIGITPVDTLHNMQLSYNNNYDRKRFANGSNANWNLAGYGRGPREIELTLEVGKSTLTVAERQTLDDLPVPIRYFDVKATSTELVTGSTPFSLSMRFAGELIKAEDGEIDNNSTIKLTYRGKYDTTLAYPFKAVVVCALTAL